MPESFSPIAIEVNIGTTEPCLIPEDWSFAGLKRVETLWGPHGYHRYPAKFIPQLVRRIIERYSEVGALVGDPFLGSATTGVEALRTGRRFWGADINPIALLVSQAKCTPLAPQLLAYHAERLYMCLENVTEVGRRTLTQEEKDKIVAINIARATTEQRFQYWFPEAFSIPLREILCLIMTVPEPAVRCFFLCAFSNILRGCSIWLSGSTKPQKDLTKTLQNPIKAFRTQVRDMIRRNQVYWDDLVQNHLDTETGADRIQLGLQDARQLPLSEGELDLIVTSSPYATCYEYIEIHQLSQIWFERHGILKVNNFQRACIGGQSVSQKDRDQPTRVLATGSPAADEALSQLMKLSVGKLANPVSREVRALRYYFQDMHRVIQEFARVLAHNKYLVLIIGDSCKRGVIIPTSSALQEMAESAGFCLEEKIVRRIPARVLVSTRDAVSGRFSSTADSDTQVYPEEDILILRRVA